MNKHFLKQIRDNIPEPLKYIAAPIFRNKLIKNKVYVEYHNFLNSRKNLNERDIKEYQFNHIKKILIYAYSYVPYYKELFDNVEFKPELMNSIEEISVIPFLTKEIIRGNFDKLISTQKIKRGYYTATTGGSTGEPLKVFLDYDCVFKENAFVNHFRSKLGYHEKDKLATFRGVEFEDKLWKYNPMQNELIFSPFRLSNKTVKTYLKKIEKFNPTYLNGYLSSIAFFAKLLSDNNLKLKVPIKGIYLISENIDKYQRDFVENFFGVKTSTFYGHSERCIIAEEVGRDDYIFDPFYGYTELIPTSNNSNQIVGTGFLNYTMPLIRYMTDDLCTSKVKGYAINGSRKSDIGLFGKNNEFFTQAAFNFHSDIFSNVLNYQFIQKLKGQVELLLVVNDKFQYNDIQAIKNEINRKTKGIIDFNIKVVEELILTKRGKFNMFISEIKE